MDNIKRWMQSQAMGQHKLADRLTKFEEDSAGSPGSTRTWHRRSINRLLNGQRRVDIDEMYSIALVLGANVGMVLFPEAPDQPLDSDLYRIGGMPPIGAREMTALLARPAEVMSRPRIGIEGWDSDGPLVWSRRPSAVAAAMEAVKRAYEEAHPDVEIDNVSGGDVVRWAGDQGLEDAR